MKIFKIFFIATALIAASIDATAAFPKKLKFWEKDSETPTEQIDYYSKWKPLNNDVISKFDKAFGIMNKVGNLTKDDYLAWKEACETIEANYNTMQNYTGDTNPFFDMPKAWKLNSTILKEIKDGAIEFDAPKITEWENAYKAFGDQYEKLRKKSVEKFKEKHDGAEMLEEIIHDTIYVEKKVYLTDYLDAELQAEINRIKDENTRLKNENDAIKKQSKSYEDAFYACIMVPLNVKYNKEVVDLSYNAAKALYESGVVTDESYISGWEAYSPLLKNYEIYNNEVIAYLEKQIVRLDRYNWDLSVTDVNMMKKDISIDITGYGKFYGTEVSIIYLDYVIDSYFDILMQAANGQRKISKSWLEFFIKNELKPIEFQQ